ncbi:GNAT family N-acetyltransferase [uncultured Amnibacterium sp.]|uniref:GNAT family N-acetyltransferase n=1 Tax=uncultured Amnibacterium sp. TaxID=1631851 RepID=UPI0035CBB167
MGRNPLQLPIDARSRSALAASGLRLALVDPSDDAQVRAWFEAESRGFLSPAPTDETFAESRVAFTERRSTGVWDDSLAEPATPVGTITCWPADLSLPGERILASWAISGVTVSPTHRRRGIARALLEAELRTAHAAGLPVAVLTVSEATIYGRFGFGPATEATELSIDTRRAGWRGGPVAGRVQYVSREQLLRDAPAIWAGARRSTPGAVALSGLVFTRIFGRASDDDDLRARRFARYDDAHGAPTGYLVYTAAENESDFAASSAQVVHLVAATPDAYSALWRFVLQLDLIGTVTARLRSTDEALKWLVANPRAVRTTSVSDHLWLRILDPVVTLQARAYAGPARIALAVDDPLDYAAGRFLLAVDDHGFATVTRIDDAEEPDVPAVRLGVAVLGSLLLGGVSAVTLQRAGLVGGSTESVALLDRAFRSPTVPWLDVWF